MALVIVGFGLFIGLLLSLLVYRSRRAHGAGPTASAGLAATVFAVVVTLLAYPLEKAFSSALDDGDAVARSGANPNVTQPAQLPGANEAWGPDRRMFTNNEPAASPVLNSIFDNPHVGDERSFLVFKDATITEAGHWQRSGELLAGHSYLFRIYVNAAGTDGLKAADLRGVVARVFLPNRVGGTPTRESSGTAQYCGFLDSSNASPSRVWSCGVFLARQEVRLFPDPGSVTLYNNYFGLKTPQGPLKLGAALFTNSGQTLGFDKMDGLVPSGYKYDLTVTFIVTVERS